MLLMASHSGRPSLGDVTSDLARRWANQRLSAVQSYGRILADYGSGRSTGSAAVGAMARLAAEEAVRYPADAIGLATQYAAALAERAGATLDVAPSRGAAPIQDLELSGPLGQAAAGEFYLKNPHDRAASLSFLPARFVGSGGETGPAVTFEPADFVLPPGQEQLVKVSVALDPDLVLTGRSYAANVAVSGFDDMVLRIRLTVLEPA
jgi:hypothetical protein